MKKSHKKRLWKMQRTHRKCCPCVIMFSMNMELCHFYSDPGCICCTARSARPDGRDLKKQLKLMPKELKARTLHFKFHALKALAAEGAASWNDAITHYEACRQTLSEVEDKLPRSLHLWLLMWASTPLVSLYHLKSQNFIKSIEISEMLMHWLLLRRSTWLRCWEVCSESLKSHIHCRRLLARMLKEFLLAYDALDRDRRLVYYEWSYCPGIDGEELRRKALEAFEYREGVLCQWLSKLHQQYGDYGRAQDWVRIRKGLDQNSDEEDWNQELYDAALLRSSGDAQGCKNKVFALADRLEQRKDGRDGKEVDPEAMATVEEYRNVIKGAHEFYGEMPVKLGKVPISSNLLQNEHRVELNWMDDASDRGLQLYQDGMFDAAVSCYRDALDRIRRAKGVLRYKSFEYRLVFLDKLAIWFNDRYHADTRSDHASEDLDTAIRYFRKSYFYNWLQGCRADESILGYQRVLGWVYGIKARRNYNDNMLLHDLSWNPTLHNWDYWHSTTEIHRRVSSLGFMEQEYINVRITEFIKAWRRSTERNRIAAVMISIQLYSLRGSADQLDDTWAIYSLSEHNLVYDGLQARLEEEMVLKHLLATCCRGASVDTKILKCMERASETSSFPPMQSRWVENHDCCEGLAGGGRSLNIMSPTQEALLWAERSRTKALLYQLFPNRLHSDALDKLHDFDLQDQVAWDIIEEARGVCGKGAVVVEYSYCHYDQIYIAYVFDQDGRVAMRSLPIEDEDEFEKLVGEVLMLLSEEDDEITTSKPRVVEILKELYFIFIDTIADLLDQMTKEDKLVIVPFEGVTELPFQLLLDDEGIYLFEKFIISITPSLRTIKYLSERYCTLQSYSLLEGSGAGLVVGDPAYMDEDERLEFSRTEVTLVSSIFEEKGILKLLGTEASLQNVLDWGRRPSDFSSQRNFCQGFVHIATHGIVNKSYKKGALQLAHPQAEEWESDLDSDLYKHSKSSDDSRVLVEEMADDSTEDEDNGKTSCGDAVAAQPSAEIGGVVYSRSRDGGFTSKASYMLSSEGIVGCGFDWRAYMVVLSACNSAKGKVLSEGVLNLPRAFLIAGVPCIVASQWLVDDELTPKLMKEFYGLMKEGRDVATSLCLAMRLMKCSNDQDLHKWGAFNVWGLPTVCLPKELQVATSIVQPALRV